MLFKWLKTNKKEEIQFEFETEPIKKCSVYYIQCDQIRSNAMRSRSDFDEDKLINLAQSIKRYGIIEPICVRKTEPEDSYAYEIVTGERRFRAAKLVGLGNIPCIIIDVDDEISAELSLTENIFSEALNYFEIAFALQRMNENCGASPKELASRFSISQTDLCKKLWLLNLTYEERQMLLNGNVAESVAVELARISDNSRRKELISAVCEKESAESVIREIIEQKTIEINDFNSELPRDVSSVLKGIGQKLKLLNRRKKRAEMKFFTKDNNITVEIQIKL